VAYPGLGRAQHQGVDHSEQFAPLVPPSDRALGGALTDSASLRSLARQIQRRPSWATYGFGSVPYSVSDVRCNRTSRPEYEPPNGQRLPQIGKKIGVAYTRIICRFVYWISVIDSFRRWPAPWQLALPARAPSTHESITEIQYTNRHSESDQFVGNWVHGMRGLACVLPLRGSPRASPRYRVPNFLQIDQSNIAPSDGLSLAAQSIAGSQHE